MWSFYCSDFPKNKKILAISSDGSGDNLSGSVYVCKNNILSRLSFTIRSASLGKIYSRVTALLGFKPWEHEYKIMGMAPHANYKLSKSLKNNFGSCSSGGIHMVPTISNFNDKQFL